MMSIVTGSEQAPARPSAARRLLFNAVVFWIAAAAVYGVLRGTYGERPAYVQVRWGETVDGAARERLEQRHGLTRAELKEGRTWGYVLTDLSRANIRALVGNPA